MTTETRLDRRGFLTGSAVAGASGAALLAGLNAAHAQSGEPIAIGSALPMSGYAAADGIEFKRGLDLAAEEINAAGGILGPPGGDPHRGHRARWAPTW
jgi:branched-chain amino acid transport system substrate-binding protein